MGQIARGILGLMTGISQAKDTVQSVGFGLLAAGNANTKEIIVAIQSVKDQASTFRIFDLERQLTVAQSNNLHERIVPPLDAVEVNVSQNVSQNQAQAQLQAQGFTLALALLGENFPTELSRRPQHELHRRE
jgi:hypothetical protein